jgi:hypothetical protein
VLLGEEFGKEGCQLLPEEFFARPPRRRLRLGRPSGEQLLLLPHPGVSSGDLRTLSVVYDNLGERRRRFEDAVQFLETVEFSDSPVKGPATVLWCCRFISQHGGTPSGWHARWVSIVKMQHTDPYVQIHEMCLRTVEIMLCFDQLAASCLASAEYLMCQVQMVEERYRDKAQGAANDSTVEAHLFSGTANRSGLCVAPQLTEWIANGLKGEAAILKERRKAREERSLAKPPKS